MISPHLLQLEGSYSYRTGEKQSKHDALIRARVMATGLWGLCPVFVIEPKLSSKHLPTWTHIVKAIGPAQDENYAGSQLVIIWWSEHQPDTDRVLTAVDWEKHAQDFKDD